MISLIAAMSKNRVIGRGGKIPWHLPADLKRFKEITMGHPVIMGRKTYESIPPHSGGARQADSINSRQVGHALPGRTNIVLSRTSGFSPPDAVTVQSFKEALDLTRGAGEVFVIGGQSLYEQALSLADKIYLTVVDAEIDTQPPSYSLSLPAPPKLERGESKGSVISKDAGQTAFFPEFNENEWKIASREEHKKDENNPHNYTYLVYERKK